MKTLKQSAFILFALLSVFTARAEHDPTNEMPIMPESRFQLITSSIEHSSPFAGITTTGCCDVTIRMKVTYTDNGQTYTKWSTSKVISPGGSDVFAVQIGNSAVVTDEMFEFKINGSVIASWTYTSVSSYAVGQNGVGYCSSCASITEVMLMETPNGSGGLKHFYFDFLI